MPRFLVVENRMRRAEYLIDAVDAEAARRLDGTILDEGGDVDDYGYEILDVTEVGSTRGTL